MQHPFTDVLTAHLKDTTLDLWQWSNQEKKWEPITAAKVLRAVAGRFAIGEQPVLAPPVLCNLAGVIFPQPLKVMPSKGDDFYVASPGDIGCGVWSGSAEDHRLFNAGLLQQTREGAEQQGTAMRAALEKAISDAV